MVTNLDEVTCLITLCKSGWRDFASFSSGFLISSCVVPMAALIDGTNALFAILVLPFNDKGSSSLGYIKT